MYTYHSYVCLCAIAPSISVYQTKEDDETDESQMMNDC